MPAPPPDTPEEVWALLQAFVEAHSPKTKLRERLGFSLGAGRGKIRALLLLADGPRSLGDLADALQVDRPYATVLVNRLEELDLVERTTDPADRRRKQVAITAGGRRVVREARAVLDTPPEPLVALSAAEVRDLGRLLAKLAAAGTTPRPAVTERGTAGRPG